MYVLHPHMYDATRQRVARTRVYEVGGYCKKRGEYIFCKKNQQKKRLTRKTCTRLKRGNIVFYNALRQKHVRVTLTP
jgi:hypothetical protein